FATESATWQEPRALPPSPYSHWHWGLERTRRFSAWSKMFCFGPFPIPTPRIWSRSGPGHFHCTVLSRGADPRRRALDRDAASWSSFPAVINLFFLPDFRLFCVDLTCTVETL